MQVDIVVFKHKGMTTVFTHNQTHQGHEYTSDGGANLVEMNPPYTFEQFVLTGVAVLMDVTYGS